MDNRWLVQILVRFLFTLNQDLDATQPTVGKGVDGYGFFAARYDFSLIFRIF